MRGIPGSYRFTLNLKICKWKTEIDSCRSSFGPPFPNREIKGPYQLLLNMKGRNYFMQELLFVLLFLIWRLQDLTSACPKWQELLWFFFSKLANSQDLTSSCSKWSAEIGSCRSSFGPSFPNWGITGPYQPLLKFICNTYLSSQSSTRLSVPKRRKYEKFDVS